MLDNIKSLGYVAVLQAVSDEANDILLATRQQWHSVGIVKVEWFSLVSRAEKNQTGGAEQN